MRLGAFAVIASIAVAPALGAQEAATPADWELPDAALGAQITPILLLSRPDVCGDLALDGATAEAARQAILDLYARAASLRGTAGPEAVAARRAIDEAAERWLDTHLSVAQRARLDQLDLQWEGVAAMLTRPTLRATLELSDQQRAALSAIVARRSSLAREGLGPVSAHREIGRVSAEILSEGQRRRWESFVGPGFLNVTRPPLDPAAVNTSAPR